MKYKLKYSIVGSLALLFALVCSESFGQRRGGGGRVGFAGGARGGAVVGPYGGSASRYSQGGTVIGPAGRSASAGSTRGSYTTPRGTEINYAGAGRSTTGPGGVTAGRGIGGVRVTTPGGRTATKVGTAGGVVGPGGNGVARGSSVGVASGPRGVAAGASRGVIATGPGGTVARGGRVGAAVGPGGAVAGGTRWGAAASPYGLAHYTARGAVVAGHGTRFVAAGSLQTRGVYVRNSFVHYNAFTPAWYRSYPNAWRAAAWTTAAAIWTTATWATLAGTCGYPPEPANYDYGSAVVYEGDQVYYNGEPVATAEAYTQQAAQIASTGAAAQPPDTDQWIALGVFGMVQGDEKDANLVFQLAINKQGIIRGNYYNALTNTTTPVYGSVDQQTQRAAWTVGDNKDTVYETGVGNLTEAESSMLVHFGKDRTQQWTLVRMDQPQENK